MANGDTIGIVGQFLRAIGVPVNSLRFGKTGEQVTTDAHGRYHEAAGCGRVFYAASQAATTWSVALNTTHSGLVVSNPIGSGVLLSILQVGFSLSVAPVAIAHMGLFGGFATTGLTAHTTPLTPGSTYIGNTKQQGLADGAATLVGTPVWLMPIMGGFTAGALPSTSPVNPVDIGGSFTVPPGGYIGIGALTAVVGFAGITWEEIPIV